MNIYVGNISYNLTEDELKEAFAKYGEVTSVKIISDKYSGRSKGFGFVEMSVDADAEKAINALNETELKDRNIKVMKAHPKKEYPRNERRY
ncbi:MAG: RNA-binding protein [Proteobacteria bacterium]|nr:RNA-binding protein [Pseudomonadota bacterium]